MKRDNVTVVGGTLRALPKLESEAPAAGLTSGTHRVADSLTLEEMRARFLLLRTARDYSPERLTTLAQHTLVVHARLAQELGLDDEEDLYSAQAAPEGLQLLRERLPVDWFTA